ncbi:MAG TPA: FAD-dependent oxidoreductase [Acidimicrobiales bacterium]
MTRIADVVVVGAGAMGSATAWELARRGIDVVVLEQFERGHARGSSHGGSRIFRFAYADRYYVELAKEARDLWRVVEDDAGEVLLEITGALDHGDPALIEPVARALRAGGCVVESLSSEEAGERWPGMNFEGDVVHSPEGGRVLADRAVAAFQRRAGDLGAELAFERTVTSVDPRRRIVRTDDGDVVARRSIVVTAGAWLESLLRDHVDLPPMTVTEEQVFHFGGGAAVEKWPSFIHYRDPARYGLVTPGEGVKVAEHGTGYEVDPDDREFDVDPDARDRVVAYVEQWLPGLDPTPVSETTCLYTNTPDSSFVLDRAGDVVVGSACSGHGFKFTPAIGKRLADLALD